jgi:hypothetical protein
VGHAVSMLALVPEFAVIVVRLSLSVGHAVSMLALVR